MSVNIVGSRIILRDWIEQDLEAYRHWQMGSHRWKELDAPYYRSSDADTQQGIAALEKKVKVMDFPNPRTRLVIADKETDSFMGAVNSYWVSKETNWLAAGISIYDPKYWGGGIGKEALSLWVDYLFKNQLELVRLDLHTWSGNEGMARLALKLGFKLEGCFRKARIVNGNYFDSLQFGILKEEWMNTAKF